MPDAHPMGKLLIANRGEIAIRIHRTATEMGIATVGVHPADDHGSLHVQTVDEAAELRGNGASAYLDIEQIVGIARERGCDAVHPGYGFLAENADFADACEAAGIVFIGPCPRVLRLFGNKLKARDLAAANGLPVVPASDAIDEVKQAEAFYEDQQPNATVILKAVAGGGGRGMRLVRRKEEIADALVRGAAEAQAAFGSGALYAERMVERALHIEVQVLGDRHGNVGHLGERDCSIQRRHQKVVEVAPSPQLGTALRERILNAAVALADAADYDNIGTFEFLVDGEDLGDASPFYFIEANPRIQVEHTVTEAVTGVDLVRAQLAIAGGATLHELGLADGDAPTPRGHAIQLRINMETLGEDGIALPRTGTLTEFRPPEGPGVRVDTFGYEGYRTSGLYDSLLAKLIVHCGQPNFAAAVSRARRALSEFAIRGVDTNLGVLMNMMDDPALTAGSMYTRYVDDHLAELLRERELAGNPGARSKVALAGARVDAADPLAVLGEGAAMVRDQVHDDANAAVPGFGGEPTVEVVVAETRIDAVVVGGGIPVVGELRLVVLEDRIQPDLGVAHVGDVVEVVDHAL